MGDLKDIKDRTPNQDTIEHLEKLLEQAKTGELRTIIDVAAYDDDSVSHGWSIDSRNSRRRLIAEVVMLQNDIVTNQALDDIDSVLARCFEVD